MLSAQVSKQEKPFEIHTPFAQVIVVGTAFTMQCEKTFTALHVTEGRVRFFDKQRQQMFDLKPGDRMSTAQPLQQAEQKQQTVQQAEMHAPSSLVRYRFDEGQGHIIKDTSAHGDALDLHIHNPQRTEWLAGGGLRVNGLAHIISHTPADKITQAVQRSDAFTIIMQVRARRINPQTPSIGMDRLLSISQDYKHRNISVGVGELKSDPAVIACRILRRRGSERQENGLPAIVSKPLPQLRQQERILIVVTKSKQGDVRIAVNGIAVGQQQSVGSCVDWYPGYHLALAQEIDPQILQRIKDGQELLRSGQEEERAWFGDFYHIEIYDVELQPDQLEAVIKAQGLR